MSIPVTSDLEAPAACKRIPSPSARNKAARLLWGIAYLSLFRFSPVPLHGWRRLVLRLFRASIGRGAVIYPSARIWAPWMLHVDDGATIGWDCELYNVAPIHIGKRAIVSQHAYLCTATHDFRSDFQLMAAPIQIGAEAWVAAGAFAGPGVTIGEGAVAGARAVATRSIPPWTIVAGNPAKCIGSRPKSARNDLHRRSANALS